MNRTNKKQRPKPVTTDDYRRDRDYWKNRASQQQRTIDTFENREYASQSDAADLRKSRDYFRDELQKLCPHLPKQHGGLVRCARCKKTLSPTDTEKRSDNS